MANKLSSRQQAQLAVLEQLPRRFQQLHRMIEESAAPRADETLQRKLVRNLDELKAQTAGIGLGALTETLGVMSMLARRTGGNQMRVRGLQEGLVSLKINYDGALRSATTPEAEVPEKG
ncbi:MAG: hypothetical protein SGI84_03895 [Gemmatimonadota bacterium]|nr:hypothetical protein [Gemmatimonadota bacterium]